MRLIIHGKVWSKAITRPVCLTNINSQAVLYPFLLIVALRVLFGKPICLYEWIVMTYLFHVKQGLPTVELILQKQFVQMKFVKYL